MLAALLHRLPRDVLRGLRLLVRPETVLRWHRDLIAAPHARISRPSKTGRPRTVQSIRRLVLRLARENSTWGYRRIHGELLLLGITIAAATRPGARRSLPVTLYWATATRQLPRAGPCSGGYGTG